MIIAEYSYSQCPNYVVLKVVGKDVFFKDGQNRVQLKTGDKLNSAAIKKVEFPNSTSIVKVLLKDLCSGGEYVKLPPSIKNKNNSTFWENPLFLTGADVKKVTTSTKGDEELIRIQSTLTADGRPIGIGGKELRFEIRPDDFFKLNKNEFFTLDFQYKGEKYHKKLNYEGSNIIFNYDSIFSLDGKPINQESVSDLKLIYVSEIKHTETFICNLNLIFVFDEKYINAIQD